MLVLLRGVILGAPVDVRPAAALDLGGAPPGGGEGLVYVAVVPTMVHRLVEREDALGGLALLVGGGRLDPTLRAAAEALGARVVTTYGLTETCGGIAYDGLPFPGTEARLSEQGAIELSGPTLMDGYRGDPQATAEAFTGDGWLRTGDVGTVDPDGRLNVLGRADDLIRTGAEKVWPDEVEAVLRTHSEVADVAVAGRPDPEWGEHVAAFVVPVHPHDPPSLEQLRTHAATGLARFKLPRELSLVAEIPRTASGKVRRRALGT
jgi:O-succinylbenzoic acid--CoA ligase